MKRATMSATRVALDGGSATTGHAAHAQRNGIHTNPSDLARVTRPREGAPLREQEDPRRDLRDHINALGVHKFILATRSGADHVATTLITVGFGGILVGLIGVIEGIVYLEVEREFVKAYQTQLVLSTTHYGVQTCTPFVKLNVDGVQNAAALRYQHW
jgi:hypothetical protein